MDFTEAGMQAVMARRAMRVFHHELFVTNTTVYGWESDLLTVTRAGIVHEYEIKTTRSDWLAELKAMRDCRSSKARRRRTLENSGENRYLYGSNIGKPNLFWMLAPPDTIADDELPDYAGLIVVHRTTDMRSVEPRKYAPRLHKEKAGQRVLHWIARGTALRHSDEIWRQHARQ